MNVIQQCASRVEEVRDEVIESLKNTEYAHRIPEFQRLFANILTRFQYIGATISAEEKSKPLPPITEFMGEKIKVDTKVTLKDITNENEAKEKYIRDRDSLYNQILNFSPSQVLNSYRIPEHQVIVRGVAKKAGVEGYDTKELNNAFIEEIQAAITTKNETDQQQAAIDAELKRQLEGQPNHQSEADTEPPSPPVNPPATPTVSTDILDTPITTKNETDQQQADANAEKKEKTALLTLEDIAKDIELQRMGAKEGMEVFTTNKGKRAVRWPKVQ